MPGDTLRRRLATAPDSKGRLISLFVGAVLLPSIAFSVLSLAAVPRQAEAWRMEQYKRAEKLLYYVEQDLARVARDRALDAPSGSAWSACWTGARTRSRPRSTAAAATQTNQKPNAPILASPVNDAVVNTMAVLKTGVFRTAAAGTTHAKTRWQVFRVEDNACVLDINSTTALTSLTVPKLVLDEGTPYFWRAQFIDSKGAASTWSSDDYFSTVTTTADRNANGIPDAQEVSSRTDLDRDGKRDNRQRTIRSVRVPGTDVKVGVSIKNCPTALAIEAVESEGAPSAGSYFSGIPGKFPFGLINFKVAVAKPGDQAAVKIYFTQAVPPGSRWYEYDAMMH